MSCTDRIEGAAARSAYVVITPVRDEAGYIERTITSMIGQTARPSRWIVVDDGSCDGTAGILDAFATKVPWMSVIHKADRGHRSPGTGVMEAFYEGYAHIGDTPWQFLVKLDGDLSFDADYFERCLSAFAADHALGIAGGAVYAGADGRSPPRLDSVGDPPFHVRGATKIYRRACWEAIAPLPKAVGWDTIDEVRANFKGWTTRSFEQIKVVQHKPTGSADGSWRNSYKNGLANYLTGYHPLFMFAKCIRRAARRPFLTGSLALGAGFLSGYLKRTSRGLDSESMCYLRHQQLRRLLLRPSIYG